MLNTVTKSLDSLALKSKRKTRSGRASASSVDPRQPNIFVRLPDHGGYHSRCSSTDSRADSHQIGVSVYLLND